MELVTIVIALALIEYSVFGMLVGKARGKYGIDAPAITGNPIFERYYRVHQNTLENSGALYSGNDHVSPSMSVPMWLPGWVSSSSLDVFCISGLMSLILNPAVSALL